MKILLVLPPTADPPVYAEPPAGLLYTGSALKRAGHDVRILDIYRRYISPGELVKMAREEGIEAVGFGGISTCYWYVKEAALSLRKELPRVHLIAGGVLSSAHELLLANTPIDVICMREGEITAVKIFQALESGERDFGGLNGVSFLKDGKVIRTEPESYIPDLDTIPLPDYSLIDVETYAEDAMKDFFFSRDPSSRAFYKKGMRVFNLKTARGCTNACSFCYRHFTGYRQHSVDYVIRHIRYLKEKYNIHFFRFGDELFTRDTGWVMAFSRALLENDLKIRYIVHGVRADTVSTPMVAALKVSGCAAAFIGFESGSENVLAAMRKNVSVEHNINAVRIFKEAGLDLLVQTVIGMPGETDETISETAEALVKSGVDPEWVGITFAQPYPGTWLWTNAIKTGIIKDPESYLTGIGRQPSWMSNYTGHSGERLERWKWKICRSIIAGRAARTGSVTDRVAMSNPNIYKLLYSLKMLGPKETLNELKRFALRKISDLGILRVQ